MGSTDLRTAKHKLLDQLMVENSGHDLRHYVSTHRSVGTSWRRIAAGVIGLTGVDVTDQTLIDWFTTEPAATRDVAS